MTGEARIAQVRRHIAAAAEQAGRRPEEITLCAATKTQDETAIRAVIRGGITVCGENRVQELAAHLDEGAYDGAQVHFIGHLQTNKVRQVVGRVSLIQSVDSMRLLTAIQAQGEKLGLVQDILLEINIAEEPSKGGLSPAQTGEFALACAGLSHVRLRGLMAIPPIPEKKGGNRRYFQAMYQLFIDINGKMADNQHNMDCLSMGMSGDYEDAILEGSTLVRLGTALFGPRPSIQTPGTK